MDFGALDYFTEPETKLVHALVNGRTMCGDALRVTWKRAQVKRDDDVSCAPCRRVIEDARVLERRA